MTVVVMRFLNFAAILGLLLFAGSVRGDGPQPDFDWLATTKGDVYREVIVIKGDQYGLIFRHQDGISKIDYAWLPPQLKDAYAPIPSPENLIADTKFDGFQVSGDEDEYSSQDLQVTLRRRFTFPANWLTSYSWPNSYVGSGYDFSAGRACLFGHRPAHAFVTPYWRELAIQDLLHSSGLISRPWGIHSLNRSPIRSRLYY
tara:strand:+ start:105 stop:707 length:603 start_codon:yes stop_codon:yes gene_type:complete